MVGAAVSWSSNDAAVDAQGLVTVAGNGMATFTSPFQPIVSVEECDGERLNTPSTSLDFGVVGGVGTHFELADRVGLSLDLLYTLGLRSTYDGELDRAAKNRDITVQRWSFRSDSGGGSV